MGADKSLRQMAYEVLYEVLEEGKFIHQVLGAMLRKYQYLDKKDRAFVARLCEGCVEQAIYLDYVIDCYSKTKTTKMKPQIRTILRMGAYQILSMEGVPDSAACNESVKLAVQKGFHGLKGFVNGVLRTVAREKERIALPDVSKDPVKYLSVRYSAPAWLVSYWSEWLGNEKAEQILAASQGASALHVVVNTKKTTAKDLAEELSGEGITYVPDPDLPNAGCLTGVDHLQKVKAFQRGDFFVQDHSCTEAVYAAGIRPGDTVVDLCSAPGGKAALAALLAGEEGRVLSRDLTEEKCGKIRENMDRLGLTTVEVKARDARITDPELPAGRKVFLADLPCSGLGVIGRKNDIKYHASPEGIASLQKLQREILTAAAASCRSGDVLLYSTCTVTKEENAQNAAWFADAFPFEKETEKQILPGRGADGFYYARFVCRGESAVREDE